MNKKISELDNTLILNDQDHFIVVQDGSTKKTTTNIILDTTQNRIEQNPLKLKSITSSTNTSTGSLVVDGGVAVKGSLNIGGIIKCGINEATVSTSTSTGTLVVSGGVGVSGRLSCEDVISTNAVIGGNLNVGGNVKFTGVISSTNSNSGVLILSGGLGLSGNINSSGSVNKLTGGTPSTSTSTGTLIVNGGIGVSGKLNCQDLTTTNASIINSLNVDGSIRCGVSSQLASTSKSSGALVVDGGLGVSGNIHAGNLYVEGTIVAGNLFNDIPKKFSQSVGNGVDSNISINHNLGTRDVIVSVYKNSIPWETIPSHGWPVSVNRSSENTVELIFNSPPTTDSIKVVIIG
jgi:hypothetical protein